MTNRITLAAIVVLATHAVVPTPVPAAASGAPFQPEPPDAGFTDVRPPQDRLAEPFFVEIERPAPEGEVLEGSEATIAWRWGGPIEKVRLYYSYERCRLGGRSRGSYGRIIYGQMLPNLGQVPWTIPWMDTDAFRLRIAGYDAEDHCLAADEIGLRFRPAELAELPAHAIGIIKRRQRLYYYEDGRVRRMHIVSTAAPGYTTPRMWPGAYDPRRGAMGRVFRKARAPFSRMYQVTMPYWLQITSTGSHGIHATSPPYYHLLGRPASHGCVRQHRSDAAELYSLVPLGTPVYVFLSEATWRPLPPARSCPAALHGNGPPNA
ncbi:MAG: L,D-transpeptidase [Armatimonadota bacterium]